MYVVGAELETRVEWWISSGNLGAICYLEVTVALALTKEGNHSPTSAAFTTLDIHT